MYHIRFVERLVILVGAGLIMALLLLLNPAFAPYKDAGLLLQMALSIALLKIIARREKVAQALRESAEAYKTAAAHLSLTEKTRQDRERWFAATLTSIGDAVITTNTEGGITFLNPAAEALTGWKSADVLGKEVAFASEPVVGETARADIVINLAAAPILIARGGTKIPIEYTGAPIKNDQGNMTGFVLVIHNITERKQAEETLRKAYDELEQRVQERTAALAAANAELRLEVAERQRVEVQLRRLEKAVETIQLGVTITDLAGKIIYTNPADARMHGYSVTELLGQDVGLFAPPDRRRQMSVAQIEQMKNWIRESVNLTKDQRRFPVYLMSSVVEDAAGQPLAIVTTCEDITERTRTQEELAAERNLLRTLIDSIPDYIYVKDRESRFLLVNEVSASSIGIAAVDEFVGKTDFDILGPELAARFYADDQQVITSGRSLINQEEPNVNPQTGLMRWLSTTKVPLRNSQGEIVGLVGISRDITEYKQTAAKIEHINLVLRAIQDVNQIIVREKHRNALIQHICESLTQTRGFHAAIIILLDDAGKFLTAAESGMGAEFPPFVAQLQRGEFPACLRQAMAQAGVLLIEAPEISCQDTPFLNNSPEHQKMAVRLEHAEKCYGILTICLAKSVGMYAEDRTLLEEVAGDIAFALYGIAVEEERQRAEATLAHERQRLLDLLENLPVYVYLQAPDYSIRFANRRFREKFGQPERELCYRLLWGRGDLWEESPTYRVFHLNKPQEWEWNHYPTGRIYQVYDYPFTDFDGSPLVLELGIDITERKHMEIALQEERALLAQKVDARTAELTAANIQLREEITERTQAEKLLQQRHQELALLNRIGQMFSSTIELNQVLETVLHEMHRLLHIAATSFWVRLPETGELVCQQATGAQRATVIGWRLAPGQGIVGQAAQTGQPLLVSDAQTDAHHYKGVAQKTGTAFRSFLSIPFRAKGEVIGVLSLMDLAANRFTEDDLRLVEPIAAAAASAVENARLYLQAQQEIAERKQAEEALRQAKEAAESANSAKSEFLANMSHELRTPLNAILGYAQFLKTADNLTARQVEGLETIRNSGQHLLNMINELLDLAKIEAGRMELDLSEFHLPEFLRRIGAMMRIRAEEKGLAFVYAGETGLPQGVRADEKKLRQILINLLGNAVKFTEQGTVSFRVCEFDEFDELKNSETHKLTNSKTHKLRFEVTDTGVGIAPEQLEEIFLPFQQVGEKRHAVEGTGLGLTISRKLVRMLGSELQVTSTVGKGSVFWFELGLSAITGETLPMKPAERRIIGLKGAQRTALIADDVKENRAVLVNMLLPFGFKFLEAADGQECLEKARQYRPDVIFLDLRMPVMDGFETIARIRAVEALQEACPAPSSSSGQRMTVIAMSASVYAEVQTKSLQAGCDAFLMKPIQLETLLQVLQRSLQLEWLYEEDREFPPELASIPAEISTVAMSLPADQARRLIELAAKGRAKKLLQVLTELETSNPQDHPLFEEIRQFAKKFQFKEMIAWLTRMEGLK